MTTVLSLNCFDISLFSWSVRRRRLTRLAHEIVHYKADIICLQEINFRDTLRLFTDILSHGGYFVFSAPGTHPLNPGGLLLASRFPLSQPAFTLFHEQGSVFALDVFERIAQRGFITASVQKKTGKPITVINTHLHCPFGEYDHSETNKTARSQWTELVSRAPRTGTIITGDLNTVPSNHLYTLFTKHYEDPLRGTDFLTLSSRNTNRKYLHKLNSRIDYTLVSPDLTAGIRQRVIFTDPIGDGKRIFHLSDHFGVWTQIMN